MNVLNNRYFHLSIYALGIILGSIGVVFSYVGWIHNIHNEFHVFFTNQSNIIAVICLCFMLVSAVLDLSKKVDAGKEQRFVVFAFSVFIYQALTMILYNFLTHNAHIFTAKFWSTVQCPVLHLFAPALFIFVFIAFTDKTKITKMAPLYVLIYPLLYSLFIFIRSAILGDVEPFEISGYIRFPYPIFDYVSFPVWLIVIFMIGGIIIFIGLSLLLKYLFQRQTKKP